MIIHPSIVVKEVLFDGRSLITEIDTKGIITFANEKFTEMSFHANKEAIRQPRNILSHPDMPKVAFEEMSKIIKEKKTREGYLKNLHKDGRYYWVVVNIVPKKR